MTTSQPRSGTSVINDFTILIQGPFTAITAHLARDIHVVFPDAPIVVSCYQENIDAEIAEFVTIRRGIDPGTVLVPPSMKPLNLNRQSTTIWNGCRDVTTKWTIKVRSDLVIVDRKKFFNTVVEFFEHAASSSSLSRFTLNTGSFNIFGYYQMPFHLHDWFFICLSQELIANCKAGKDINEQMLIDHFDSNAQRNYRHGHRYSLKFHTEQIVHFGAKLTNGRWLHHCCDTRPYARARFILWVARSLSISTLKKTGLKSAKVGYPSLASELVALSAADLWMYRQFVNNTGISRQIAGCLLVAVGQFKSKMFRAIQLAKHIRGTVIRVLKQVL